MELSESQNKESEKKDRREIWGFPILQSKRSQGITNMFSKTT